MGWRALMTTAVLVAGTSAACGGESFSAADFCRRHAAANRTAAEAVASVATRDDHTIRAALRAQRSAIRAAADVAPSAVEDDYDALLRHTEAYVSEALKVEDLVTPTRQEFNRLLELQTPAGLEVRNRVDAWAARHCADGNRGVPSP